VGRDRGGEHGEEADPDEHVDGFNASAAEMQARIGALTEAEAEAGRLREELEAIRPQLEQHNAYVLGLEQTIAEEQRKREEAERRAAGNITIRGFEDSIARAVEKGWADHAPKPRPKREKAAA
jgi:chromosome segregation ATPase